jgi:truncated hemoglobin YjbI/dihydrofolate reductase
MSRIVVINHVTLDGVMQAPGRPDEDTRGGFEHGGWSPPYGDEVMGAAMGARMAESGGLVLGRRTYEDLLGYWNTHTDSPFAEALNNAAKYVASRTLSEPLPWPHSTLLRGDAADAVAELKVQPGKDLHVMGSAELIQALMRADLIDEYMLLIHPLVLGSGLRLFPDSTRLATLRLTDSVPTTTGVVITTYQPAGSALAPDGRRPDRARRRGVRVPVPEPEHEPTLFEWAGGFPALTRMTRIFYEKYVPDDPLLSPLFAEMAPDHPERVAAWLGETFGGPKAYTEGYGGYERMVSRHLGKALREQQRARWVQLLCRAADDAKLPADPEWRAAFVSYLEWGSRIALENSQPGAHPPPHMPVPRWWWVCDATPGSRVSALAAQESEEAMELPGHHEQVSFEQHVKLLFREVDRQSMRFAFDLWSHDDVAQHADAILDRLRAGTMPCDGAWPGPRVEVFERWVGAGKPE